MEESWINLQQQRLQRSVGTEDDAEDVISGPSTESSASSMESIGSPREPLAGSGTTEENLRASYATTLTGSRPADTSRRFGTLLKHNRSDSAEERERIAAEEKHRRDTITSAPRPVDVQGASEADVFRRSRRAEQHKKDIEEDRKASYWFGFYAGISVGIGSAIFGMLCWQLRRRLPFLSRV